MSTSRSEILNLLATGQISADEASELLRGQAPATGEVAPQPHAPKINITANRQWIHIRVSDLTTGRNKVNVNLPLAWVQVGMNIGARYQPEIANIDWEDVLQQVQNGAAGKLIEVEDEEDNERVEIYVD